MHQDKQKHTVYTASIKLQMLSLKSFHRLGLALSYCSCVMMCGDVIYYFYSLIEFRAWEVVQMLSV